MVGSTIAEAARTLVKTLWDHHGRRPFYHPESSSKSRFSTNIQDLIKAMISVSPSPKSQKAITPALLRCMAQHTSGTVENNAEDHMADLIIGAFFFAMRSCEYVSPKEVGRTITIRLGGISFFNNQRKEISHSHPHLLCVAIHVRILFEDQKIGRSARREPTEDPEILSYVLSYVLDERSNAYSSSPKIPIRRRHYVQ